MNKAGTKHQVCTRGVWDTTIPGIVFDENGVSNYAKLYDKLCEHYPRGEVGRKYWETIVQKIKTQGRNKRYDCIIGVSGGTDSSYLLYMAKELYGLRPLAVNLDNGWNSEIAVQNIKRVTKALNIDLETYVIDYEEVKAVLRAYMKAGLPWIDGPTDQAIKAVLYRTAYRENVKFILNGNDFRSEGKQPSEWTYSDARQMRYVVNRFEKTKLKSFPIIDVYDLIFYSLLNGIKTYSPLNNIDYQKKTAQKFLNENFGWQYYGGHHHENIFTKFTITYWMLHKFGIDKRIITLSAQVLSGEITREYALEQLRALPYDPTIIERDIDYVLKKLDLDNEEFNSIWFSKNHFYREYPSYMPFIDKYYTPVRLLMKLFFPVIPSFMIEKKKRDEK